MPTNIEMLNAIRFEASTLYQDRIPLATRENITEVANALLTYEVHKNEFLDALFDKVTRSVVTSKMATNKLAKLKKGFLEYGRTVEEIFISQASGLVYDPAGTKVFDVTKVPVDSIYHSEDRRIKYPITVYDDELKKAFMAPSGLNSFVARYMESMYSADADDEYIMMKNMIAAYYEEGGFYKVTIPEVDDEATGKTFIKAIRTIGKKMGYMNSKFNKKGVRTKTDASDLLLIIHTDISAVVDVDVLAAAFNMDKASFMGNVIEVDDFGSDEQIRAVLVDRSWMQWYDTLMKTTSFFNPDGLYWNYWLHHWAIGSISRFSQAVAFTLEEITELNPPIVYDDEVVEDPQT